MFPPESLTLPWLQRQAKTLGNCNQDILERSLYALTLLGHLEESGLSFIFKGGTSLLLHLILVDRGREGSRRSYRYRLEFERDALLQQLLFDEQGKLVGTRIEDLR